MPIYDYIRGESEEFLVMPLLRAFDDPPFYAVEEVLDFVRQTLEVSAVCLHGCASFTFT